MCLVFRAAHFYAEDVHDTSAVVNLVNNGKRLDNQQALFGVTPVSPAAVFDRLADHVDRCFAPGSLMALLEAPRR